MKKFEKHFWSHRN